MHRIHPRNGALFDRWSIVHMATGVIMGWLMDPWLALGLMVAWEPLEIFVLSPLLAKIGIEFGYETWRNSLSDIFFDMLGIALGYLLLSSILPVSFRLWT
jgi:hypothetical protein